MNASRFMTPILNRIFIIIFWLPVYFYVQTRYSIFYAFGLLSGIFLLKKVKVKGVGCRFHGDGRITNFERLELGNYVHVGENFYFFTRGRISIGDGTVLSRNVSIYSANHKYDGEQIPYGHDYVERAVHIGRGVWVGMNVNILPGVTIGDGAVIGMGATVASDVGPGVVYVGAKCRSINQRDIKRVERLVSNGVFYGK